MSPTLKEIYLNGNCHIFAIALHELTNLSIWTFVEDRTVEGSSKARDGLIHAFCLTDPDGEMIFDAKGIRHVDELNKEYTIHDGVRARFFYNPRDLLVEFDKAFGEKNYEVETAIEEAKDYIETYLSEELKSVKK